MSDNPVANIAAHMMAKVVVSERGAAAVTDYGSGFVAGLGMGVGLASRYEELAEALMSEYTHRVDDQETVDDFANLCLRIREELRGETP